ncbi:MAG: TolC family protein [Planctomycetota bacterium]
MKRSLSWSATVAACMAMATAAGCANSPGGARNGVALTDFDGAAAERFGIDPKEGGGACGSPDATPSVLPEHPTLDDCLRYAALNNQRLEAAFENWRAAQETIAEARGLPDPKITYSYYIQQVETRVGPQRQAVSVMQTFPGYGKLDAREAQADAAVAAARARYDAARRALVAAVTAAYAEYYYLGRSIAVTEDNVKLLANLESIAQAKQQAGAASEASVIKAQVELDKLRDMLKTQQALAAPLRARLNVALGREVTAALSWPREIAGATIAADAATLQADLAAHNPELAALQASIAQAQAGVTVARRNFDPDVTVGLNWIDTGPARMPVADSGQDAVVASVGFNIPLWFNQYTAAVRENLARAAAADHDRQDRALALQGDLQLALFQFHDAERKIRLYRDTLLPEAERSLATLQASFTANQADFLNLIDAERTLLEFQLSYQRARADLVKQRAAIEALVGMDLPGQPEQGMAANEPTPAPSPSVSPQRPPSSEGPAPKKP